MTIEDNGQVFKHFSGVGPAPISLLWDGRDDNGNLPGSNSSFDYRLTITPSLEAVVSTVAQSVTVLIERPAKPVIISPSDPTQQGRAVVDVAGTAGEAGQTLTLWLQRAGGQVL